MDLQTFLVLQRSRVGRLDHSELDQKIRKVRFVAARGSSEPIEDHPEPYPVHGPSSYDSVKAGYRKLRMIYA